MSEAQIIRISVDPCTGGGRHLVVLFSCGGGEHEASLRLDAGFTGYAALLSMIARTIDDCCNPYSRLDNVRRVIDDLDARDIRRRALEQVLRPCLELLA